MKIRMRYRRLSAYLPPRSMMGLAHTLAELAPRYLPFSVTQVEVVDDEAVIHFPDDQVDEAIAFLLRYG